MLVRALCLFVFSVATLLAQTGTSRIRGVVTDASGALVPGAAITARHESTGAERSLVSNASGQYSFDAMPLGKYTVTVALQGFKKATTTAELQVGEPLTIDIKLEPGAVTEQVLVSDTSAQVQT